MILSTFKVPSAWLPIAMSVVALAVLAASMLFGGNTRETDEGATAHLWQLLMAGQVPVIAWFVIRWVPKGPRQGLIVLAVQIAAIVAAAAPVALLGL